jgi:hypothetical protein
MASKREIVMLAGRLVGMGRDESCLIGATKVSLLGTDNFTYTRMSIQNAPRDMPEGQYTLHYDGRSEAMVKRDGEWFGVGR